MEQDHIIDIINIAMGAYRNRFLPCKTVMDDARSNRVAPFTTCWRYFNGRLMVCGTIYGSSILLRQKPPGADSCCLTNT